MPLAARYVLYILCVRSPHVRFVVYKLQTPDDCAEVINTVNIGQTEFERSPAYSHVAHPTPTLCSHPLCPLCSIACKLLPTHTYQHTHAHALVQPFGVCEKLRRPKFAKLLQPIQTPPFHPVRCRAFRTTGIAMRERVVCVCACPPAAVSQKWSAPRTNYAIPTATGITGVIYVTVCSRCRMYAHFARNSSADSLYLYAICLMIILFLVKLEE